jgi:hypothetical protein
MAYPKVVIRLGGVEGKCSFCAISGKCSQYTIRLVLKETKSKQTMMNLLKLNLHPNAEPGNSCAVAVGNVVRGCESTLAEQEKHIDQMSVGSWSRQFYAQDSVEAKASDAIDAWQSDSE